MTILFTGSMHINKQV